MLLDKKPGNYAVNMKIKKRKLVPKRSGWRCLRDKNHPDKALLRDVLDYLIAHISKEADLAFFFF